MKAKTSYFRFRMTDTQYRALISGSTDNGETASDIVRRGIDLALAEQRTEKKETARI